MAHNNNPSTLQDPLHGHDTYEKIKDLNRGAYGLVLLAKDKATGDEFALKFIERGPQNVSRYVHREIVNHMKLRHPHVISLREVFLTQQHLVLVMEYAPGGDLFSLVQCKKGLKEPEARWYFQQIAIAIDYCHKMGVCSRDIKLENTLLDSSPRPLVKLCDFGFSKDSNYHSAPGSRVGTPAYLAPEVIAAGSGARYDGYAADIWSLGVLLYVMVCGAYPFRRPEDDEMRPPQRLDILLKRIQAVEYGFPPAKEVSPQFQDLISKMLVRDPALRSPLSDILRHPWVQEGLSPEVLNFNQPLVAKSLADPVTPEMENEIARIVNEASASPGWGLGNTPSQDTEYLEHVDAMLQNGSDMGSFLEQI